MKRIFEMTVDEIVTAFLRDRGLDSKDKNLRAEYDPELVRKAKRGDHRALIELLKIGRHYGKSVRI